MKVLLLFLVLPLFAVDNSADLSGRWSLNGWVGQERVRLKLERRSEHSLWSYSSDFPLHELTGLTRDQMRSLRSSVRFELSRDAGALECSGNLAVGIGSGGFQFQPSNGFRAELLRLGYGSATDEQLFTFATQDLTLDYLHEAARLGLKSDGLEKLASMRAMGVDSAYLREVVGAGYKAVTAGDIIQFRIHGVDGMLLRELQSDGYRLSAEEVCRLRAFGIDPQFLHRLKESGAPASAETVIQLRVHGVDPSFVASALHYRQFSMDDIIRMRTFGVPGDYFARLANAGFKDLPADQIVKLRVNGID